MVSSLHTYLFLCFSLIVIVNDFIICTFFSYLFDAASQGTESAILSRKPGLTFCLPHDYEVVVLYPSRFPNTVLGRLALEIQAGNPALPRIVPSGTFTVTLISV